MPCEINWLKNDLTACLCTGCSLLWNKMVCAIIILLSNKCVWYYFYPSMFVSPWYLRCCYKRTKLWKFFNPLGTTGLLTPFLIGSYHEMFTCSANYDKSLKMLHHKLTYETIFLTYSLIGSINVGILILTNRLVVLMGLISRVWTWPHKATKLQFYSNDFTNCMVLVGHNCHLIWSTGFMYIFCTTIILKLLDSYSAEQDLRIPHNPLQNFYNHLGVTSTSTIKSHWNV